MAAHKIRLEQLREAVYRFETARVRLKAFQADWEGGDRSVWEIYRILYEAYGGTDPGPELDPKYTFTPEKEQEVKMPQRLDAFWALRSGK